MTTGQEQSVTEALHRAALNLAKARDAYVKNSGAKYPYIVARIELVLAAIAYADSTKRPEVGK